MAVLTLNQLQDLFFGVTVSMTGLANKFVRHAYQAGGQPAWKITENVAFINITTIDDAYDKQRDISYLGVDSESIDATQTTQYTRVIAVDWTVYGPLGYDLVNQIRSLILSEPIRDVLRVSEVFPIPGIQSPTRVPYNHAGQWWERNDLRVRFNVNNLEDVIIPYLTSANIQIESGGNSQLINIDLSP